MLEMSTMLVYMNLTWSICIKIMGTRDGYVEKIMLWTLPAAWGSPCQHWWWRTAQGSSSSAPQSTDSWQHESSCGHRAPPPHTRASTQTTGQSRAWPTRWSWCGQTSFSANLFCWEAGPTPCCMLACKELTQCPTTSSPHPHLLFPHPQAEAQQPGNAPGMFVNEEISQQKKKKPGARERLLQWSWPYICHMAPPSPPLEEHSRQRWNQLSLWTSPLHCSRPFYKSFCREGRKDV